MTGGRLVVEGGDSLELRDILDAAPMSIAQIVGLAVTTFLSAIDGYDILSITFAAPSLTRSLGLDKAALGLVLSSSLFGMLVGSLAIGPIADVAGRRPLVMTSLALLMAGTLLTAFGHSAVELTAWRFVTGLGIGSMVAVIVPLAAELSNTRHRQLAIACMVVGTPVGGLFGGALAAWLLRSHDWPSLFFFGFAVAGVALPVVGLLLPESPSFLVARRPRNALARVNRVLASFGHARLDALPPTPTAKPRFYRSIFAPDQLTATLWITLSNLLFVMAAYFILSWIPQIASDMGFAPSVAALLAASSSAGGIVAVMVFGACARRVGLRRVVPFSMIAFGLSIVAFGCAPPRLSFLVPAAIACGGFGNSGIAGLYAYITQTFEPGSRASGTGFVVGVGRGGSALAPLLAGALFALGAGRGPVSIAFGVSSALAAVVLLSRSTRRSHGQALPK